MSSHSPSPYRIAIVEDQRQTRDGLATLIGGTEGFCVVGAWRSMEEALPQVRRLRPHVMLTDIGLPGMSGIEGVRSIKGELPELQILMLTIYGDDDHVFEAICAGACGYLLKDTPPERLLTAITEACDGGAPMSAEVARRIVSMFQRFAPPTKLHVQLTAREREVLQLLADAHSYKTAAIALDVSLDTLRSHVRSIYDKLHVNSKSEAVLKAFRAGLIR